MLNNNFAIYKLYKFATNKVNNLIVIFTQKFFGSTPIYRMFQKKIAELHLNSSKSCCMHV